ncbi:MAG: hypothetical protein AAGC97_16385 [Planctomycetota bacterium]
MSRIVRQIALASVAFAGFSMIGSSNANADYFGVHVSGHPVVTPSVSVGVSPIYHGPSYTSVPTIVHRSYSVPTVRHSWTTVPVPAPPVVVSPPRYVAPRVRVTRRIGFWY